MDYNSLGLTGPIPKLEDIAILLNSPIEETSPDILPGLLPRNGGCLITGETNVGKAQPLDAKVLTPTGWKLMGNLSVGDHLATHDGQHSEVLAIHLRGNLQIYRISFSDGRTTEVCGDHLWRIYQSNYALKGGPPFRILSTQDLIAFSDRAKKRANIDTPQPIEFITNPELPVDPWLLGVLIGDGTISGAFTQFTSADAEIVETVQKRIPNGLKVKKLAAKYGYSIVLKDGQWRQGHSGTIPNPLKEALKNLGVSGCRSWEKFIPEQYLFAPCNVRIQLLAGLMDTDGYIDAGGSIIYTTTSPVLAQQVVELVRSLGGVCSVRTKKPWFRDSSGQRKEGRLAFNLYFTCPNLGQFMVLRRRAERITQCRYQTRRLTIKSIIPSRIAAAQCITVSHPEHLYITNDYIVTHNSLVSLEIVSSFITGQPLWGHIKPTTTAKKIVYILGEHHNGVIQRLWQRTQLPITNQVWLLGPEQMSYDRWLVNAGKPNLPSIEKFKKWCEGADLILWDPISAFVCGSDGLENDSITMRLVIDTINLISATVGATSLVLAHQGKPMVDQFGKEHSRTKYATRGTSAQEDAATSVFYLNKDREEGRYELICRKFKGEAPPSYQLLRSKETLTHSLLENNAYIETKRLDARNRIGRLMISHPNFTYRTAASILASLDGVPQDTMRRWLGITSDSGDV